jgi:sulfite reductase (NADPH) flavoprotein alpha-component
MDQMINTPASLDFETFSRLTNGVSKTELLDLLTLLRSKHESKQVTSSFNFFFHLTTVKKAICHNVFGLSDISVVFPGSIESKDYFGHDIHSWASKKALNMYGERGYCRVMQLRENVGDVVLGLAKSDQTTTVMFNTMNGFSLMHATIHHCRAQSLPVVFHIDNKTVHETSLEISSSLSTLLSFALQSSTPLLISTSPQQAYDFSILSHIISKSLSLPVLHTVSSIELMDTQAQISALLYPDLKELVSQMSANGRPDSIVQIFDSFTTALGGSHSPVSYMGPSNAMHVVVLCELDKEIQATESTGVVRIHLLSQCSFSRFASLLPASVMSIEYVGSNHEFYDRLIASCPPNVQSHMTTPSKFVHSLPLVDFVHAINTWGISQDGSATASLGPSLNILERIAGPGVRVQGATTSGVFDSGAVSLSRASVLASTTPERLLASSLQPAERASLVVVSHPSIVSAFDTFAPLVQGGTVLLNAVNKPVVPSYMQQQGEESEGAPALVEPREDMTESVADASTETDHVIASLYEEDRHLLFEKRARVFIVNSEQVATKCGLSRFNQATALVLLVATFLLIEDGDAFSRAAVPLEEACRRQFPSLKREMILEVFACTRRSLTRVVLSHEPVNQGGGEVGIRIRAPSPLLLSHSLLSDSDSTEITPATHHSERYELGPVSFIPSFTPQSSNTLTTRSSSSTVTSNPFLELKGRNNLEAMKRLLFPGAYLSSPSVHPTETGVYVGTVLINRRLTPLDYDRNIFHIEIDISNTGLKYEIGSALGVHAHNVKEDVDDFLAWYGLDPDEILQFPSSLDKHKVVSQTVFRLFSQEIDLFGRPSKEFYEALSQFAVDEEEKELLSKISKDEGLKDFLARAKESYTYADVLREFSSARPPASTLIDLIPRIKPRHYSIASSMKAHPSAVHLLVVEVEWTAPSGKRRFGLASHYLANLVPGASIAVSVLPSEMHLPKNHEAPVVMAGLGTGMAPFRAFIQERAMLKRSGVKVGPMVLYFGSRFRAKEYLYGDELEKYSEEGLLQQRLAFSRDSPKKVYIQHLMTDDSDLLYALLRKQGGHFYLCGPTWPEPDVELAIAQAFAAHGESEGIKSVERGVEVISEMKAKKSYVLEVY